LIANHVRGGHDVAHAARAEHAIDAVFPRENVADGYRRDGSGRIRS
jgi:hypothetical protein